MHKNLIKFFITFISLILMQNYTLASVLEFAQISDVHYSIGDNNNTDKYLYFLSLSLKKNDLDFAVFLGDNINKSREDNIIGFMRSIHSVKIPYYIVLGNNDAHKLSGIEKEVYLEIVSVFNKNQKNKNYYYFKPNKDFICVVLDNTPDFAQSTHGEISDEQTQWLDKLLTKNPKKLFIIFQHSPIIPPRTEYKFSTLNTENFENLLKKHSNIILISSGHYHQEAIQEDDNGVRHISAPAFADKPHSYQIIKINYDKKTYKSPKDVEISVTRVKV